MSAKHGSAWAPGPPSGRTAVEEEAAYDRLKRFTDGAADRVERSDGFVYRRGFGFHVLFKKGEMLPYFNEIREEIRLNGPGAALQPHKVTCESEDRHIWESLVKSLKFNGIDFEHMYKIVPSEREELMDTWNYTFAQNIVLSHTLLLVPVMQHYGPLMPKLDLKGPAKKLEVPQPLLAVGLIGDCVKGPFFEEIMQKADKHDAVAMKQRDTLLDPKRLQQKLCGLVRALLEESSSHSPRCGLRVDAVLVGTGAFGGSQKALAQPFVDSLNGIDMPFDKVKDEVNFFIFPPPPKDDLTFESLRYSPILNPKKGLGAPADETSSVVRVVVAGFDPISIAPHGVIYRTFSAEGQLCHATDLLWRLTGVKGRFVPVKVPDGKAWESPAAFFARPRVPKFKPEEGYDSVRFVPESALDELGHTEKHLVLKEKGAARVWNGDSFEGWKLERGDGERTCTRSWQDCIPPRE